MTELPEGWINASISDLVGPSGLATDGDWIESKDQDPAGDVRLIQLADVGDGHFIDKSRRFLTSATAKRLNCTFLEANDVLVARMPDPLGRACIFPGLGRPSVTAVDVFICRPPAGALEPRWLMHSINSPDRRDAMLGQAGGTTRQRIAGGRVKQLEVPTPPLPEQRRIVAKIDSFSAKSSRARDHLDHIPRLIEKYKKAVLTAAYEGDLTTSWRAERDAPAGDVVQVCDVATVVTGATPPTVGKASYFGGSIAFFKPTDLDAGYHVSTPRETLTDEGARRSRPVPSGATLVTCIGATIGKTGFARVPCCTNQQINALVADRAQAVPEWLFWMVVSPPFQAAILDNASATTLPIINKGRFEKLSLTLPLIPEQREIVRRIETAFAWIDRLAAEATSARKLVDRLHQAVLAKAFRGELVPQDPADEPASSLLARIKAGRAEAAAPARRGRKPKVA